MNEHKNGANKMNCQVFKELCRSTVTADQPKAVPVVCCTSRANETESHQFLLDVAKISTIYKNMISFVIREKRKKCNSTIE